MKPLAPPSVLSADSMTSTVAPWTGSFGFGATFRDMGLLLAAVAVGARLQAPGPRRAAASASTSRRS